MNFYVHTHGERTSKVFKPAENTLKNNSLIFKKLLTSMALINRSFYGILIAERVDQGSRSKNKSWKSRIVQ